MKKLQCFTKEDIEICYMNEDDGKYPAYYND